MARLLAGESCALVTDAGMPAISDPGEDLVRLCAASGIVTSVIPGACAAVSALALSGICTKKFVFEGFLPANKSERKKRLDEIKDERRTIIFYEAPHKLKATLSSLIECYGEKRRISLCRELTKLNEEIERGDLLSITSLYNEKEPRGEYVLILEGGDEAGVASGGADYDQSLTPKERVEKYASEGMQKMDAIKKVAKELGVPKSQIYDLVSK